MQKKPMLSQYLFFLIFLLFVETAELCLKKSDEDADERRGEERKWNHIATEWIKAVNTQFLGGEAQLHWRNKTRIWWPQLRLTNREWVAEWPKYYPRSVGNATIDLGKLR